jgi:hypothetical protein
MYCGMELIIAWLKVLSVELREELSTKKEVLWPIRLRRMRLNKILKKSLTKMCLITTNKGRLYSPPSISSSKMPVHL